MRLQEVYAKYRDKADFWWVYVREAHPKDRPRPASHVELEQPTSFERRLEVATTCSGEISLAIPQVVDDMAATAARAYNALPDRLFVLRGGKVVYRGERGPRGFKVDEMEQALARLLP